MLTVLPEIGPVWLSSPPLACSCFWEWCLQPRAPVIFYCSRRWGFVSYSRLWGGCLWLHWLSPHRQKSYFYDSEAAATFSRAPLAGESWQYVRRPPAGVLFAYAPACGPAKPHSCQHICQSASQPGRPPSRDCRQECIPHSTQTGAKTGSFSSHFLG